MTNPNLDEPGEELGDEPGVEPGEAARVSPPDATAPPADPQLARIQDYRREASQEQDSLLAVLGGANSDLLLKQYNLNRLLDEFQSGAPDPTSALADFVPAVNTLGKLGHQVCQFTNLILKRQSANSRKPVPHTED